MRIFNKVATLFVMSIMLTTGILTPAVKASTIYIYVDDVVFNGMSQCEYTGICGASGPAVQVGDPSQCYGSQVSYLPMWLFIPVNYLMSFFGATVTTHCEEHI